MSPKNELINMETGEVYEGLAIPRKKRYPKNAEFMTMFRYGWDYLANLNLKPSESKVMYKLMARLSYENWIGICQETIAEELGMKQPHVARAIKALVNHQIIEKVRDPEDKRRWKYRLNADLGWKGDANQWKRHQNERLEQRYKGKVVHFPTDIASQSPTP